jgi:hypothetical protein
MTPPIATLPSAMLSPISPSAASAATISAGMTHVRVRFAAQHRVAYGVSVVSGEIEGCANGPLSIRGAGTQTMQDRAGGENV